MVIGGILGAMGKFLPTIVPIVAKGAETAIDYFSDRRKKNLMDKADDRNKDIINFQNTILPTPDRGSENFRYMPRFNDEMDTYDRRTTENFAMSRDQFGSGSENFGNFRRRRGDSQSLMNNFEDNYRRPVNQGYKRSYNVYAENSLGGGYGRNSSLVESNEMASSRGGLGFDSQARARIPLSFDAQDEYAPSRKFLRRMPENTTSRFGGGRVANLNFDTREIERLLEDR